MRDKRQWLEFQIECLKKTIGPLLKQKQAFQKELDELVECELGI